MKGVSKDGKGYRLQFTFNGERCRLRLKGHNRRQAEGIKRHIDALTLHKTSGQPLDMAAASWLNDITEDLHERLQEFGLVAARDASKGSCGLIEFVGKFIKRGKHNDGKTAKPLTLKKWRTTQGYLKECFGESVSVDNVTAGDAIDFRSWVEEQDSINSENTIRKHCQVAQMFFNAAIDAEMISRNPFRKLPTTSIENKDRYHFVTREEFDKCVQHCPDLQWKVILYLTRIAGMRCPSELVRATWDDVDWKNKRFTIHATKTEGHEGRSVRCIPLFKELEVVLQEAWEQSEKGETRIMTRYKSADCNLRTTFKKIIERAGLKPWPRLLQNMRASRENELLDNGVRPDVAAAWIGHSQKVQQKSYLSVSEHHFEDSIGL